MFVVMFCLRLIPLLSSCPPSPHHLVSPRVSGGFVCRVLLVALPLGVLPAWAGPAWGVSGLTSGVFCLCFLGFWGWGGGSFSSVMLFRFVVLGVVCASRVCAVFFVGAGRSPASGDVAKRAVWVAKSGGESLLSW